LNFKLNGVYVSIFSGNTCAYLLFATYTILAHIADGFVEIVAGSAIYITSDNAFSTPPSCS